MTRVLLGALLLAPVPASAHPPYTCGMAVLRDVTAIVETVKTPTTRDVKTRRDKKGREEAWVETSSGEREEKSYVLSIDVDDLRYTAESAGNVWNFDPTRLVINDPMGVCVDGKRLVLTHPDGKDFKARIARVERHRP